MISLLNKVWWGTITVRAEKQTMKRLKYEHHIYVHAENLRVQWFLSK